MVDVVSQIGDVTLTLKQKGVEEFWAGKRNYYQVKLTNQEKKTTTFTFYDSSDNFSKPLYHEDLLSMILNTIYRSFKGISFGVNQRIFYKPTNNKGLQKVLTQDWVDNIALLQKLTN